MLNQPTIEKLQTMKLHGRADALREQIEMADSSQLSFEERFGLLVDRQWTWKEGRALTQRLQLAKFKERGVVEDIDYQHPRGLDRKLLRTLATSDWVRVHHHILFDRQNRAGEVLAGMRPGAQSLPRWLLRPTRENRGVGNWLWRVPTAVSASICGKFRASMCWG